MNSTPGQMSFDDFGLVDPQFIREKVWPDLYKQHRIPERYRLSLRTWAAAISRANLLIANRLMTNAPRKTRDRIGVAVVYEKATEAESRAAQAQIAALYREDLIAARQRIIVAEAQAAYAATAPSEIGKHVNLNGRAVLDTSGIDGAEQFEKSAMLVYALLPDFEHLQKAYRAVMDREEDVLRVVVGSCIELEIPTGRLDAIRARPADLSAQVGDKSSLDEFRRVLRPGGTLFVEATESEIGAVLKAHKGFERLSPRCAGLVAEE